MSYRSLEANKKVGELERDKNYTVEEFTPVSLVRDCLCLIPFQENDFVIDAGSGVKNKVWFDNIPVLHKEEFEILDGGRDFLKCSLNPDWVVGNPPFTLFVDFLFKSADICSKGFGFLINNGRLNQITPARLRRLEDKGFYWSIFFVCGVKKWFGRYYFVGFTKNKSEAISYSKKNYCD